MSIWDTLTNMAAGVANPEGVLAYKIKQKELAAENSFRNWQMKQQERELATQRQKIMMDASFERQKLKKEYDPELIKAKALANFQAMQDLGILGGGVIPPGTTLRAGGMTVPLNPAINAEQGKAIAGGESVAESIGNIKKILKENPNALGLWQQMQVDKVPYLGIKDKSVQELKRNFDQLKATIPFAKGGKQLTPFEAKLLFSLVNTTGRDGEVLLSNLDKFQTEFKRLGELTKEGSRGISGSNDGTLKTSSGVSFTYKKIGK